MPLTTPSAAAVVPLSMTTGKPEVYVLHPADPVEKDNTVSPAHGTFKTVITKLISPDKPLRGLLGSYLQ